MSKATPFFADALFTLGRVEAVIRMLDEGDYETADEAVERIAVILDEFKQANRELNEGI
jgi:hypothetical protein